ncbi:hypothetical protein [Paraburkholderia sp. 2C]
MSILQSINGVVFMKKRNRGYWIAGAFFWGLTSAAVAGAAGTLPERPAAVTASAHPSPERPPRHAHARGTEHAASAKATPKQTTTQTAKQPEQNYSAALSQYQFAYGNANVPFSPPPNIGASSYAGTTVESQILKRNSTQYGAPATPASSVRPEAPDDNWRFMANPLINATHIHEIGAAVSLRHDF